jgi:serine/threonine protein kinase
MDADAPGPVIWPELGSSLGGGERPVYRVGRLIHQAESAQIYEATNEFGRPLVLKVYRPEPMQGEPPLVQWQRERRMLALVNHPQVLRLHDAFSCGNLLYLALEPADANLEEWISRHGPLAEPALRELARQLLEGLQAIHACGIVHLDVSPVNVLVQSPEAGARLPRFKIADFGISLLLADGVELSRPSEHWAHLPPELLQPGFRSPNSRCDLYGLGITLLLAVSGSMPLTNALPLELVERQVQAGLPSQIAAQLAHPLGPFIATLLQVRPEHRYGSALEAWRALRDLA